MSVAIHPPKPGEMSGRIVLLWPFAFEQRLSFPIVQLLFPIRPHRVAAMVPDHSSGVEPHRPALFLQPQTNIDVITRDTKLRVKSADRLKGSFAERHVAAGNVLCLLIGKEDMDWAAGCIGHTISDRSVGRRCNVWAAHGCMGRMDEGCRKISKPVGVGKGATVEKRHEWAGCRLEPGV